MTAVTNALSDEVLHLMPGRPGNIEEGVRAVRALRTIVHRVRGDLHDLREAYTAIDTRVGRIERRLTIVDAPVS